VDGSCKYTKKSSHDVAPKGSPPGWEWDCTTIHQTCQKNSLMRIDSLTQPKTLPDIKLLAQFEENHTKLNKTNPLL